jgi:sphingomyelin phosphodiesterase acid-like 3
MGSFMPRVGWARTIRTRTLLSISIWILIGCGGAAGGRAQAPGAAAQKPATSSAEVLFVSDIHFEPFWDPGKAERLKAAPETEWNGILSSPATAGQQERFAALQQTCRARGADTSFPLYQSSLRAMRVHASGARFTIVSGDLIAHDFSCKFAAVFPKAAPGEYRAFVEKTVRYVLGELRAAFPGVPVYAALGNNDSDCGDYQIDVNSEFLASLAGEFTHGFPLAERQQAMRTFGAGGYYSVSLPAPVEHTRLLVLDDLFMSRRYQNCGGKTDEAPAEQIAWLKQQLDAARRSGENVWVMSHIPPGVDPYSTARKAIDICSGAEPQMFLSSEKLPETMAEYGDVIRLAIFAHTHQDELRLLEPPAADAERGPIPVNPVPVKIIASISPIDGNNPSFTVGQVDAATATLKDYRVIAASNQTGVDTRWAEEYDFARTYHEPAFTGATLSHLISGFRADSRGQSAESQSYLHYYMTGVDLRALATFWQPYVCALGNDSASAFRTCMCGK